MKIEDIEKALELKRKIEECQDDLKGLDVAADYRLEGIYSGYGVFSAYLQLKARYDEYVAELIDEEKMITEREEKAKQ